MINSAKHGLFKLVELQPGECSFQLFVVFLDVLFPIHKFRAATSLLKKTPRISASYLYINRLDR